MVEQGKNQLAAYRKFAHFWIQEGSLCTLYTTIATVLTVIALTPVPWHKEL